MGANTDCITITVKQKAFELINISNKEYNKNWLKTIGANTDWILYKTITENPSIN